YNLCDFAYPLLERCRVKVGACSVLPMPKENQQSRRVVFEHPVPAHMMAIDGTWRRACSLRLVSEAGATLQVDGAIEGLALKEFFLLLSSTGLAYRRCQLAKVNGEEVEVSFLSQRKKQKPGKEPSELT